jgi:autoinducer 2-degrading protein
MGKFALWVVLTAKLGDFEALHAAALENAAAAIRDEPGCRRFDVLVAPDGGDKVMLYENYDDEAAFDAHRTSPHYLVFREKVADLLADRVLEFLTLTSP